MPRNSSGNCSLAEDPFVPNTTIVSADVNSDLSDIIDMMTDSLSRSGKGGMQAALAMGSHQINGLSAGTASTDAANVSQLPTQTTFWVTAAGSTDALTATYSPAYTALTDGIIAYVRGASANTTTTPTFSPNGLTAHTITKYGGAPLVAGDIKQYSELILRYNLANTRWELLTPCISLGALAQPVVSKTTSYTLLNTDNGKMIAFGGGASYTVTVGAPAGFDSDFVCSFYCSDSRGKLLSINGYSNYYLMPGQTVRLQVASGLGIWIISPFTQRYRAASPTIFVGPAGNDANDGLTAGSGNALATIQAALTLIKGTFDGVGGVYNIQLATGTYTENWVCDAQPLGNHIINLTGDTAAPQNYLLTSATASTVCTITDRGCIIFSGVEIGRSGAGSIGVSATQLALVDFDHCIFGSFDSGIMLQVGKIGRVNLGTGVKFSGNAAVLLQISAGGSVEWGAATYTFTTTCTFTTVIDMIDSGTNCIVDAGTSFSGTSVGTKYSVALNASLNTSGVTMPGNSAGGTSTGGQAV